MLRKDSLRRALAVTAIAGMALSLAACGGSGGGADDNTITVWTLESLPDRMKVTEEIAATFTEKTGITVDLVGIDEAQAPQLLQSSGLSDDLPDVMAAFPLGMVHEMNNLDMVDTDLTKQIVSDLDASTFQGKALELMQEDGTQIGVPSDGWAQILVYRTDLFEAAGLAAPTDYASLQKAAETLTGDGRYGITLATDPSDVFTQQTFEALALGNDCQLVDDQGTVTIDSPACQETFTLYDALTKSSPAGNQTVDSTRASYFNGKSAMTMWSTYLLDEMAGLRDDALPSCPECAADPTFLAKNTGVVLDVKGPSGSDDGGSFGEVTGFVPMAGGNTEGSKQFIEFMMDEGYEQWLGMAPEGKFPMRTGTAEDPEKFTTAWASMETGVDRRAPLGDFYSQEVIDDLTHLGDDIDRWALPEGQGAMLGSFTTELPLSKAISEMASGNLAPDAAAGQVATASKEMVEK